MLRTHLWKMMNSSYIYSSNHYSTLKRVSPRRALMYVPGNDERKIAKIPSLKADCVCLDIEDGVSVTVKDVARINIRKILEGKLPVDFGASERTVRINSVESGFVKEDLEAIFKDSPPQIFPDALHLPKVQEPDHVRWFADQLSIHAGHDPTTYGSHPSSDGVMTHHPRMGLILFVETARGLINLPEILKTAQEIGDQSGLFTPEAIVFGSDDFLADIGATRTENAYELLYARQKCVVLAKAYGLQAIDIVHIDFKNLESLRTQCEEGARMGFTGKQVIHPGQIQIVQECFSPSPDKVEWATQLIAEFREHENKGTGAFNFRGRMIDMPLVKQAQNILDLSRRMSLIK